MSGKRVKKIDIHIHTMPTSMMVRPNGENFALPHELTTMYEEIGIEKGLLLPSGVYGDGAGDVMSMREAVQMVKEHPAIFGWWFCGLAPESGRNSPHEDLSFYLNQLKAHGAKGLGELVYNRTFDEDPFLLNLLKHCELCDLPVTIHIGNRYNDYGVVDELGLPRLEHVLQMFPKLKILGHSQKFWAEISSDVTEKSRNGYPKGKVIPGRVPALLKRYPNLFGDMSAGSGWNAIERDREYSWKFMEEFQDQLLYGTDICSPKQTAFFRDGLANFLDESMEKGKISYKAYYKICRGNALYLLDGTKTNIEGIENG